MRALKLTSYIGVIYLEARYIAIRAMQVVHPGRECAVLVAAPRRGTSDDRLNESHLDELARLADTAGASVVGRLVQRVVAPTPNLYLGAGKVEALKQLVAEIGGTLVLFDEELSPVQGKNLERALDVRIVDRAELILDIFATRARTNEAKMEVELAQLEYLLPRLARMWVHLSRIRGGIGLRGPGETQIETDRRMIRRKISRLKERLLGVERHRDVLRARRRRRSVPTAAFVGYTNAGKSSLLRVMTGAETLIEDRLFATIDTRARETQLGPGSRVRLVDTVGFIRKLPHHLIASFRATLEEAGDADILLHVVDASHPHWEDQVSVVDAVLGDLGLADRPVIHVFNKIDRVTGREAFRQLVTSRFQSAVCVSASNGEVDELVAVLLASARRTRRGASRAS